MVAYVVVNGEPFHDFLSEWEHEEAKGKGGVPSVNVPHNQDKDKRAASSSGATDFPASTSPVTATLAGLLALSRQSTRAPSPVAPRA